MKFPNTKYKNHILKTLLVLMGISFLCSYSESRGAFSCDNDMKKHKKIISSKPNDANAHYMLGATYLVLGKGGEALDEYQILKKLDKGLANKLFNYIYKDIV